MQYGKSVFLPPILYSVFFSGFSGATTFIALPQLTAQYSPRIIVNGRVGTTSMRDRKRNFRLGIMLSASTVSVPLMFSTCGNPDKRTSPPVMTPFREDKTAGPNCLLFEPE